MINEDLITMYTTGLYSVSPDNSPRYDEFRDMFSSGQLKSKDWAISTLAPYITGSEKVLIVGAWFGTLGLMLSYRLPVKLVTLLDIDPRCKIFIDDITRWKSWMTAITADMYLHEYNEDVVINTSCEHIPDLKEWLGLIPKGTLVLLQSNNNDSIDGHINCSQSIDEFVGKSGIENILYKGEFIMPMYTRFMIIGYV